MILSDLNEKKKLLENSACRGGGMLGDARDHATRGMGFYGYYVPTP